MGVPDRTLVDLIEKVGSWISWRNSDSNSCGLNMTDINCNSCCHCGVSTSNSSTKYHCQNCGRLFCGKCVQGLVSLDTAASSCLKEMKEAVFNIKMCKLCFELGTLSKSARKCTVKVHPSESPRQSIGPPSLTFNSDKSFSDHPSPVSVHCSSRRSDEDEGEDSTIHYFGVSSEYFNHSSDIESVYLNARDEFSSFTSVGSSPSDSPSRIHITSNRVEPTVQREQGETSSSREDGSLDQEQAVLVKPAKGKFLEPFNFETNGLIWIPPPPNDVTDEENSFFTYDDEDDEVGDSGEMFSLNANLDRVRVDHKEPLRAIVQGHFRNLVYQLLQGQGIILIEEWLNVIPAIAWQAANFIKPDTSRGGSMDPCDYVKVKSVASGNPSESKLIKGIVCTKNLKHKRMTSQYRNTRLLLLGGSLEYQRVPNQLASFDTLLQQENNHLKMVVSKIEAHRPNVLLVEKSVSSFAQDQLLAKDISLVLNVKRQLLERIARCGGATLIPSIDHIPKARLGQCELFHLEKITEEHERVNQFNRRPSKTLMFFEGFPRRLGCTVLLKGSSNEELKKVKNVVRYAVFAAYHLLLETSFLSDEGATLQTQVKSSYFSPKKAAVDSVETTKFRQEFDVPSNIISEDLNLESGLQESLLVHDELRYGKELIDACDKNLAFDVTLDYIKTHSPMESPSQVESQPDEVSEYYSANENSQSILVSFSSHCVLSGTVCERSRLLRVKFYGSSDKPLGRYLKEDLFDESSHCRSCNELTEGHVICYTHQDGNLMINVKRLSSVRLPGKEEGKIWMWHRCLKCTHIGGVPPAKGRVVMSDAAWGLSFGKFLELNFSNHDTGNRVAGCGHSLQRDCLKFYGFGNMVAFFQYLPINILAVRLPPAVLEFCGPREQIWIRKEASELLSKAEALFADISAVLNEINCQSLSFMHDFSDGSDLHRHVLELNDELANERTYYKDSLQLPIEETHEQEQAAVDILEINRLRYSLLISSHVWDRRLYLLHSLLSSSSPIAPNVDKALTGLKLREYQSPISNTEEHKLDPHVNEDYVLPPCPRKESEEVVQCEGSAGKSTPLRRLPSPASIFSDTIDSAWCGADLNILKCDVSKTILVNQKENPPLTRLMAPVRVCSFDTAQRIQERMTKTQLSSLHLSTLRSFHASGDYKCMLRDPVSNVQRTYSPELPHEAEKVDLATSLSPSFFPFLSLLPEGARLMVPQNGPHDVVITIYDNEPTSILSYALSSKEYADWINGSKNDPERGCVVNKMNSIASDLSTWQSFGSVDLDCMHYSNYTSKDTSTSDTKNFPHFRISFEDDSCNAIEKMRFDVICYFAKQFCSLRTRCCPNELDFIRSLSRCKRWSAQGGKSNVYFAKSFDECFIIKQVTKTELESFEEFSSQYFKHLTDALRTGSPTCLAKILGIYQVAVKPSKGGKEMKMDLMVIENLFFRRSISKVYDLKGSARSRYISGTTGANKVLLDMNLLETLRTNPIFLGSKAKRMLERAVWNDTSFLASVDVMDYSLLVGVDEERKELVLGIIDYMRQYTWDKHLETWVKASGILGGPKNASPTIISPKQYKKRFRKAMTSYFLTVPDQLSF